MKLLKVRMDKDTLSKLIGAAVNTILSGLVKVIDDKVMPAVEDGEELKVVLKRVVTELQSEFKPVASNTVASSNKTEGKAPAKPKAPSKDVLKDANNNVIQCEGVKKSDSTRCQFGAKHKDEATGKHYCGTHIKTSQSTKPNKDKKPAFDKKATTATSSLADTLENMDDELDLNLNF